MANYQQRTADWCIQKAWWRAFRKAAPAQISPKYLAAMSIIDDLQKMWADEAEEEWASLFSYYTLVTPMPSNTSGQTTPVALDANVDTISKREGFPILVTPPAGGNAQQFDVINPNQLYEYRFKPAAAVIGRNLVFSQIFAATDALAGGSIQVPIHTFVPDIALPTDNVVVDRPMWLVYMLAAELVRNDIVKRPEYNNLLSMGDAVMQKMLDANEGQREEIATSWRPAGESWV